MDFIKKLRRNEKEEQWTWVYRLSFVLVLAVVCFLSFYQLDEKYVDPFDEARHGVNAYEMFRQGNLIKSTYGYETDYYNLKPPLSMWCIMLGFLLFGKTVFALRAYSAVCYILLVAFVGMFVKRNYGRMEAILAMGFLALNTAPFEAHMIRAGDADSLYVLLFTLAMLYMMEIPKNKNRLYLCGLFFSLAFLTKSFHAGMILAIGGLYLLFTGELKKIRLKEMVYFVLSAALPLFLWGVLRLSVDGVTFFKQMLYVDVLNRTSGVLNNNKQPFFWYAEYFLGSMSGNITIYLWAFVICMVGVVFFSRLFTKEHYRKVLGYGLWILIPYIAFSSITNKLVWYMYPVTIPLLMCAGVIMGRLLKEKKISLVVKLGLLIALFSLGGFYGNKELQTIKSQGPNEFQQFVTQIAQTYGDMTDRAFLALASSEQPEQLQSTWAQQDVYLAEIYGDWYCDDSGVEGFDNAGSGILFVGNEIVDNIQQSINITENDSNIVTIRGDKYTVFIK